jgi:hypothetical protein
MSREHQYIGLTGKALNWLDKNVMKVPDQICPHCNQTISYKQLCSVYESDEVFYDKLDLLVYNLTDGRIAKQVLQAQPWSSGPMSFLCLEIEGKRMFRWTQKEMDQY